MHHDASRHGRRVELAVEWEYSILVCIDCYGCVVNWALVGRMCRDEHIICIVRTYREGMILVGWVVEVDQQSVAPVCGYDTGRECRVCFHSRGKAGVERLVNAE